MTSLALSIGAMQLSTRITASLKSQNYSEHHLRSKRHGECPRPRLPGRSRSLERSPRLMRRRRNPLGEGNQVLNRNTHMG